MHVAYSSHSSKKSHGKKKLSVFSRCAYSTHMNRFSGQVGKVVSDALGSQQALAEASKVDRSVINKIISGALVANADRARAIIEAAPEQFRADLAKAWVQDSLGNIPGVSVDFRLGGSEAEDMNQLVRQLPKDLAEGAKSLISKAVQGSSSARDYLGVWRKLQRD
jgi:hypothetical protein